MKEYIYKNKIWLGIILCLVLIIIGLAISYIYYFNYADHECITSTIAYSSNTLLLEELNQEVIIEEENIEENIEYIYIDIKGSVKNPGVYKIQEGTIINDALSLAGGVKSTAITSNINLSKIVSNEMVIYVFDENDYITTNICELSELTEDALVDSNIKNDDIYIDDEINNKDSIIENDSSNESNNCEDNNVNQDSMGNSLINLNTASKEELMTLTGIGESKALAIIEYRLAEKFNSIYELVNVSGIGDSTLEAIKNFITV